MSNPSKTKGTEAESAVVKTLKAAGFRAKRLTLHGNKDVGDVDCGLDDIVIEVKGGHAAESASDGQIEKWRQETEVEKRNAGAAAGALIVKRKGIGPTNAGRWWVVLRLDELDYLQGNPFPAHADGLVRIHLHLFIDLLLTFSQRRAQ